MSNWMEIEKQYYMPVVRRQPVVIVKGQGTRVWDDQGKEYLDFTAGWAVTNLGHSHPAVTKAIQEQAATLIQTSNQFYTLPQLHLAKLLVENSCLQKVFFGNSGAEANEGAVKLARKYGKEHLKGAYEVIVTLNSFHGRTLSMTAATGTPRYHEPYVPLTPGFVHVPFNDVEAIKKATTDKTCAVMLEPVQGEGGVVIPAPDYLKRVREWCDEPGILLILDEIQTGMGRLGTLFGYQHFGVEPDVITLAKGLGNGVPIGAFLVKERYDVLRPGDHGSTFGGNALTCAAAYAATKWLIEHKVPENATRMGKRLTEKLEQVKARHEGLVKEVRGVGLLLAVEFHDAIAPNVLSASNGEGLLLNTTRPNVVRFMPPLTITPQEVDEGVVRFERALTKAKPA